MTLGERETGGSEIGRGAILMYRALEGHRRGEDVAWLWSQVAQAAICQVADRVLGHAQWSHFRDDLAQVLERPGSLR